MKVGVECPAERLRTSPRTERVSVSPSTTGKATGLLSEIRVSPLSAKVSEGKESTTESGGSPPKTCRTETGKPVRP